MGLTDGMRLPEVGGTVGLDRLYLRRPADDELVAALRGGEYSYVLAPRQMGKSSLRVRTEDALRHEMHCVSIDLTEFTDKEIEPAHFYFGLVERVAGQLSLGDPVESWEARGHAGPLDRFVGYLRGALAKTSGPVVVFIDEIDAMLSLSRVSRDGFFAAVRALGNARATDPVCRRLTFCLLGVAQPGDLIEDETRTPFNIGRGVVLDCFTREQLRRLEALLDGDSVPLIDAVYEWAKGHPAMTMKLCTALVAGLGSGRPAERVEGLVQDLFLRPGLVSEPSLSFVAKHFERGHLAALHPRATGMLGLYGRLRRGEAVPARGQDAVQMALRLTGLVAKREDGGLLRLEVCNRIFATVFDEHWVRERQTERLLAGPLEQWLDSQKRAEHLLQGEGLQQMLKWAEERDDISPDERAFLMASTEAAQREGERRFLLRGAAGALVVVCVLLIAAISEYRRAKQAHQRAEQALGQAEESAKTARTKEALAQRSALEAKDAASRARAKEVEANAAAQEAAEARQDALAQKEKAEAQKAATEKAAEDLQQEKERGQRRKEADNMVWKGIHAAELAKQTGFEVQGLMGALKAVFSPEKGQCGLSGGASEGLVAVTAMVLAPTSTLSGHSGPVHSVAFSSGGSRIVTASADRSARVWDAKSGKVQLTLSGHSSGVLSAAFSPDGTRIVTASADGSARLWDAKSGKVQLTLPGHSGWVNSAAFSPDGTRIVTAGADGSARLWDAKSGKIQLTLPGHSREVYSVAFSPDGTSIVTASADGSAKLWNAKSGKVQSTLSGYAGCVAEKGSCSGPRKREGRGRTLVEVPPGHGFRQRPVDQRVEVTRLQIAA